MHVNDLRTFKISQIETEKTKSTSSDQDLAELAAETEQETVTDYFDNSFGDPLAEEDSTTVGFTGNSNPLDDYTCGNIKEGEVTADPNSDTLAWLADAPPSLNDLIADNDKAICYLDMVKAKYEKFNQDMLFLKQSYQADLDSGALGASEVEMLLTRIDLVDGAITKCKQELENTEQMKVKMDAVYRNELVNGKDLNNDGWIGQPYASGSYIVQQNDDGTITLIDAASKKAVQCPFFDPSYQPTFTTEKDALKIVDIADVYANDNYSGDITVDSKGNYSNETGNFDLCLAVDASKLQKNNGNYLDVAVDLGIPQTLWVEKDEAGSSDTFKYVDDESSGFQKLSVYDKWSSEGGIHQELPGDLSKYMQIEVTDAVLSSQESGLTDLDGNPLYYHTLELRNGYDVIARIRIGGTEGTGPLAADTAEAGKYIAASTVSMALNGNMRTRPLSLDAGQFKSTGRHTVSEETLLNTLGIEKPTADDSNALMAFNETFEAFTGTAQTTKYFDPEAQWVDHEAYNYSDRYQNSSDCYLPASEAPGENDTLQNFHTGLVMYNMRGIISGSNCNDIIKTLGANEYTEYAEKQIPKDLQKISKGDALWNNVIEANGGNNIVVAGIGDNNITNGSLVYVKANNVCDNTIQTPSLYSYGQGTGTKKGPNPKAYVKVDGGADTFISNADEYNQANYRDDDLEDGASEFDRWENSYDDDYYEISSSNVHALTTFYENEWGSTQMPPPSNLMPDATFVTTSIANAKEKIEAELSKEADVTSDALEASWENVMAEKTMLDDEMNGFFSEMFGDVSSFTEEADGTILE